MTTTKNKNLNLTIETVVPENVVKFEFAFSKQMFKDKFREFKFIHQMIKASEEVFETWFNSYPRHEFYRKSPFPDFWKRYAETQKLKWKTKEDARVHYLTYAFLRKMPRSALEKKRKDEEKASTYVIEQKHKHLAIAMMMVIKNLPVKRTEISEKGVPLGYNTPSNALKAIEDSILEWLKA